MGSNCPSLQHRHPFPIATNPWLGPPKMTAHRAGTATPSPALKSLTVQGAGMGKGAEGPGKDPQRSEMRSR